LNCRKVDWVRELSSLSEPAILQGNNGYVQIETPAVPSLTPPVEADLRKLQRRINNLRQAIAQACAECGCTCLARRINPALNERSNAFCPARPDAGTQRPALDLLPLLTPLSGALSKAGYYDTALECANMAKHCEPVLDVELTRAFLLLVLGDTEEAREIYTTVVRQHGGIPQRAVERVAELAQQHSEEEDIAELLEQLRHFIPLLT
jgi:hypothetical protein